MAEQNYTKFQRLVYGAGAFLFGIVLVIALDILLTLLKVEYSLIQSVDAVLLIFCFLLGYFFPKLGLRLSKLFIGWAVSSMRTPDGSLAGKTAKQLADGTLEKPVKDIIK